MNEIQLGLSFVVLLLSAIGICFVDFKNVIGNLVLYGLCQNDVLKEKIIDFKEGVEINLVINEEVVDIKDFIDRWQKQVETGINKIAHELLMDKFGDKFDGLEEAIRNSKDEIKKQSIEAFGLNFEDTYYD